MNIEIGSRWYRQTEAGEVEVTGIEEEDAIFTLIHYRYLTGRLAGRDYNRSQRSWQHEVDVGSMWRILPDRALRVPEGL